MTNLSKMSNETLIDEIIVVSRNWEMDSTYASNLDNCSESYIERAQNHVKESEKNVNKCKQELLRRLNRE